MNGMFFKLLFLILCLILTPANGQVLGEGKTLDVKFGVSHENSDEWKYDTKSVAIPDGYVIKKIWIKEHRRVGNVSDVPLPIRHPFRPPTL